MKRMMAGLLVAVLSGVAHAVPQISVGSLYDYVDEGSSTLLKRIRNLGDTTAFVKLSVVELVYDANGKASEVSHDDTPVVQRPLITSSARLIVPANGMQAVRLLYRGDRERERYFRLRFVPVLPESGDGFAITEEEARRYETELKAGVTILAGYGTLAFIRPKSVRYSTEIEESSKQFSVRNGGNTTVVLDHFNHCNTRGTECAVATKHHIRPGLSRTFDREAGRVYRFELIEGKEHRRVEIKD